MNVIIDLDNTIISSLSANEEKTSHRHKMDKFIWENMDNEYKVFSRPGLDQFLDYLFKNFKVSVWTAASKSYALFIIDNFILIKPDRKLKQILFSYHCKQSKKIQKTQKKLSMLWTRFNLGNEFSKANTIIIDDHLDVYNAQPDQCIRIKPFKFTNRKSYNDEELKKVRCLLDKFKSK